MPLHSLATDEAVNAFIGAFMDDTIFTTSHFPRTEHPMMLSIVFPTYVAEHEAAGIPVTDVGPAFEQRSRSVGVIISPFTGYQYPVFDTCDIIRDEEWQRVAGLLELVLPHPKLGA